MVDILLDNDGDISLVNGKISLTNNTAQAVKIRLKTFRSEYFLDIKRGIPYYQSILGKKTTKQQIDSIFKKEILSVKNVLKIVYYKSFCENQTYYYIAKIMTKNKEVFEIEEKI